MIISSNELLGVYNNNKVVAQLNHHFIVLCIII